MNIPPARNSRLFVRIAFDADVHLQFPNETLDVRLMDIALKGALLQCEHASRFTLHQKCRLILPMAEDGEGIVMAGHIAHLDASAQWVGLECTDIDLVSLTRLRRLITLNAGDPALIDRELSVLFGAPPAQQRA